MQSIVIDCSTGKTIEVELSPTEVAARESEIALSDARLETLLATQAAATTERESARQAMANLQAYIDLTTPTTAQTVGVVKLLCRVAMVLVRHALRAG